MNVAVTRAKHFLWVVGNSRALNGNNNWKSFISSSGQEFVKYEFNKDISSHGDNGDQILEQTLIKQRVPEDYYHQHRHKDKD